MLRSVAHCVEYSLNKFERNILMEKIAHRIDEDYTGRLPRSRQIDQVIVQGQVEPILKGTYVNCEPFHLFRYSDEQAFRFNEREDTDSGRFLKAVKGIVGRSLTFNSLTGKDQAEGELMPA